MIKPYFNSILHIKNLTNYRDFIKKRPTKIQQFRLSMIRGEPRLSTATENGVQLKLLKSLKIAKPVRKVDLQECQIMDYDFWEPQLIAACKKISNVKTFCLMCPKIDSEIKYFKYFPKLKNLLFQLDDNPFSLVNNALKEADESPKIPNYLKTLKYCPKIRSLDFADIDEYPSKTIIEHNRSLRCLESLVLRGKGNKENQFEFPLESCQNLRSISLQFPYLDSWDSLPQILNIFSKLPNLQEIDFSSMTYWIFDFLPAFRKITKKGILKKVKFELGYQEMSKIEKVLDALKPCHLTHFSLKTQIKGEPLKTISRFIQSMDHLESLYLHILNYKCYLKDDFVELCKQINKLQELKSLALIFPTSMKVSKDTRISNFIPYLYETFTKPVKIEIFDLECDQLDPSEALQSLLSLLENSAGFLTHLKIAFGALPCTDKTYQSILKLMQNLSRIRALKIPCLTISGPTSRFLKMITNVVYESKHLRMFVIGEIKGTVPPIDLYNAVKAISSKRGLRKFDCILTYEFQRKFIEDKHVWDLDLNRLLQKNPYLETFVLTKNFNGFNLWIYKWIGN